MKWFTLLLGTLIILIGYTPPVYSWGSAIHAYIGNGFNEKGVLKANVIYGQMAADTFNFMFEAPPERMTYLYAMTHGFTPVGLDTVLPVLSLAETQREKAVAFGFVTHNNVNGADVTAHGVPYNSLDGYIISKATELNDILKPLLTSAGIEIPDAVLLEVSHTLVEYAADLLIREADRNVGARMISAAMTRDDGFPDLLSGAYAYQFAETFGITRKRAAAIIHREEAKFRRLMIIYGTVLQYGDQKAKDETVKFLAEIAPYFLGDYGIEIPQELLLPLIQTGIDNGMILCRDDLLATVKSTIENLKGIDWGYMQTKQ